MTRLQVLAWVLVAVALGACTTTHLAPKDFELEEPWPRLTANGSVAVTAGQARAGLFTIELPAQKLSLDLTELADSLAERVRRALRAQGISIRPDGSKTLELEVVYTNVLPGSGRFHCVVDFTVRAGSGYVRGHQAREASYDPKKACNAALSRAALELLADPRIQDYLAAR